MPPAFKFEMHGFVSGSVYVQDAVLSPQEGQHSLFAVGQLKTDKLTFGGDVRQSRFNFSIAGPKVFGGATPKGVLEIDWLGGYGTGNYGNVSVLPRMRLAYAELAWTSNRIAVGQMIDLIFPVAPVSLAHIAFPVGYGTGNIGWRRPGIWGFHKFGGETNLEFAWMVGRSQWADAPNGGIGGSNVAATASNYSLGEASGLPAVEARFMVNSGKNLMAFVAGHWNRVDISGAGVAAPAAPARDNLDVIVGNAGVKGIFGPLTLIATGYTGKNTGPLVGSLLQFNTTAGLQRDVHDMGGFVNAGFNFSKEFSLWGFYGVESLNTAEAIAAYSAPAVGTGAPTLAKLHNTTTGAMLQYRDGGMAVGLEWYHFHTKTATLDPADGNQYLASMNYFF